MYDVHDFVFLVVDFHPSEHTYIGQAALCLEFGNIV